ncbi:MAG: hypothetical protein IPI30_18390 [Saprospiraceae bacterium]|nr:hypothetical protein [Candidatus Vicinibacter affinis]
MQQERRLIHENIRLATRANRPVNKNPPASNPGEKKKKKLWGCGPPPPPTQQKFFNFRIQQAALQML